ncbi:MAG: hypothetical protein AB7R40_23405 [Nitrospiraceae bacterium]
MENGLPGLFGRIGRGAQSLFGGPGDPRLSPAENQNATREAILRAGLGLISGSGPGSRGTLPTLAEAIILGRDTGTAARGTALQKKGHEEIANLLQQGGIDANGLRRALITAVTFGNMDDARTIASILPSLQTAEASTGSQPPNRQQVDTVVSASAGAPPQVVQALGEGTRVSVQRDPLSGRVYWESAVPSPPEQSMFIDRRLVADENSPTGWSWEGFDRQIGAERRVQGAPPPGGSATGGTAGERVSASLGNVARVSNDLLTPVQDYLRSFPAEMMRSNSNIISLLGRVFADDPTQAAVSYAAGVLNPAVRYLSGAQMTEQESKRYDRMLFGRFGESEETGRAKERMRVLLISAMDPSNPQIPPAPPGLSKTEVESYVDAQMGLLWARAQSEARNGQAPPGGGGAYDDLIPR